MRLARIALLLVALVAALPLSSRPASADLASTDGFLYLLVSTDESFEINVDGSTGSTTVLVNVGILTGGGGIFDTRFLPQTIPPFALPPDVTLDSLDGNAATLVGSYQLLSEEHHMVTPVPGAIDPTIQSAVFLATHDGSLDALNNVFQFPEEGAPVRIFPTTYSIALTVANHLPGLGEGGPTQQQIEDVASAMFETNQELDTVAGIVASEGELFPHEDFDPPQALFHVSVGIAEGDEEGEFTLSADVCRLVTIDVMPGTSLNPVNLKKKGVLPIAFLSDDVFDATEIDGSTLRIGSVSAKHYAVEDVDGDGVDDLICHFDVPALKSAGVLTSATTSLTVRADLTDGSCVQGTDSVSPK